MFFRLSVYGSADSAGQLFRDIWYWGDFYKNLSRHPRISLTSDKNIGHLTWRRFTEAGDINSAQNHRCLVLNILILLAVTSTSTIHTHAYVSIAKMVTRTRHGFISILHIMLSA